MENFSSFWSENSTFSGVAPVIGYTDATDPRIIQAATEIQRRGLARPVLINSHLTQQETADFAQILLERQKKTNPTLDDVKKQLQDPLYQGIAMLLTKKIDGLVSGSLRPTADIVKAALQCVGAKEGQRLISGHFLIETEARRTLDNTPFLFADCAVVPEPSPRALAAIAIGAAASYKFFTGKEARVALLSFSTRDSATHPLVDRIKEALDILHKQEPHLVVDGEMQVDAAIDMDVAVIKKAKDSSVAGRSNVFVFPTLEAGNIGYKLVQRFGKARIAGPLLWGLGRPMSDLSRGCTIQEVIDTTACVSAMARGLN